MIHLREGSLPKLKTNMANLINRSATSPALTAD